MTYQLLKRIAGSQIFHHLAGDVGGVLADAAEQGRAHAVLEAHAEEGETRSAGCDATPMQRIAVEAEHRQLDPAEVGTETRAPDYGGDIGEDTSVSEHRGAAAHADCLAGALEAGVREGLRRHA